MNEYQEITPISRNEAEAIISGNRPEDIPLALVRLAYVDATPQGSGGAWGCTGYS